MTLFWSLQYFGNQMDPNKIGYSFLIVNNLATAIAYWIHLRLPSCRHGFKSQAHHLCFYQILFELWHLGRKDENKQKEAGIGRFKK